jgi:hypothetical protein
MHTSAGVPPAANLWRQKKTLTMNSATLATQSLRVEFQRRGDRFVHQVSRFFPDGTGGLLISQDGRPDETWPASPALQSLHLETRPSGVQFAMLIGMAGRSHWSMSVKADAQQNRLVFDVACRVHEQPIWLGSTYSSLHQHGSAWPLDCLSLTAWHGSQSEQQISLQIDRLGGIIKIPAPQASGPFPNTVRWRYEIGIGK